MGQNIKEAIERILGVPLLTNGRSDLSELSRDAQKREAKAAQKNQKTQSLGNQHEALLKQRDGLQDETNRLRSDLETLRTAKVSQEDLLRKWEKTKALLDERIRLQDEVAAAESRLKEKEERRKELLAVAWKGLLSSRIRTMRDVLEQDLRSQRDAHNSILVSTDMTERLRKALDDGECSTCGQELSDAAKVRLSALVSDVRPKEDRTQLEAKIQQLESRITALKQTEGSSNADVLQEVQDAIDMMKIQRATAQDRLQEIRDQTKDLDEAEMRRLYSENEKTVAGIGILQDGIKKQEEAVKAINENIKKVEAEIAKFADADLDAERARKELCENLKSLFAQAVDAFRERLRAKVEKDATALFLELTSEPEYKALSINDSYGLTIVHQDGSTIPVRSAGAEHIVALSLMGALQRNAPLRGPIVMDSPFGRLDNVHTAKVVQALPSMADQVMLLVYESELDPKQARNQLEGKLRKEYRIARRSARHSDLEAIA
jgi:DNA sulfur modification protein DndD